MSIIDLPRALFPTPPRSARPPTSSLSSTSNSDSANRVEVYHDQHGSHPLPSTALARDALPAEAGQEGLSLKQAQQMAKSTTRRVACLWRGCDALIASFELLQKHLDRHVDIMHARNQDLEGKVKDEPEDHDMDSNEDTDMTATEIRCHWDRCAHHRLPDYDALRRHIRVMHVFKLVNDHCPHRDCIAKGPSEQIPAHVARVHPGPWSKGDLPANTFEPRTPNVIKSSDPLPPVPLTIPPYLLSSRPILPFVATQAAPSTPPRADPSRRNALRSRQSTETTSSDEKVHPIVPSRDPDDYWPMNGEAICQTGLYSLTSSIFPPVMPVRRDDNEMIWLHTQQQAEWKKHLPMTFTKKPKLPRRPLLFTGADIAARRRKEELRTERKVGDRKGKRKATDDDLGVPGTSSTSEEPRKRFAIERVTRASANRAARVTGRTIGIARLEEMIAFEKRGIELGELPPDFSLAK